MPAAGEGAFAPALVPGLDMCNHAPAPSATWTVYGAPGVVSGAPPDSVCLVAKGGRCARTPFPKVIIKYSNKIIINNIYIYVYICFASPY